MKVDEAGVLAAISARRATAGAVLVVAIDGEGAAGKTTLAARVGAELGAAVVHTDDFFREMSWARRRSLSPAGGVSQYYDVTRLREQALAPLRAGAQARFACFDWYGEDRPIGERVVEPSGVVLLEGVCSAGPELADLVDLAVYVATEEKIRRDRIVARDMPEQWDARWLAAERAYFDRVRRRCSFDLVVDGASAEDSA